MYLFDSNVDTSLSENRNQLSISHRVNCLKRFAVLEGTADHIPTYGNTVDCLIVYTCNKLTIGKRGLAALRLVEKIKEKDHG